MTGHRSVITNNPSPPPAASMEKEVYLQKHDTERVLEKGLMLDSGSPLKDSQ